MLNAMLKDIGTIYIAYGPTDFRKQINSLCDIVQTKFKLDPYNKSAFIFCNKKKNSIRVLCYDKNGFVLAQKRLLETEKMRFQWPKEKKDIEDITKEQLSWLLCGLKIHPEKYFNEVKINNEKIAI